MSFRNYVLSMAVSITAMALSLVLTIGGLFFFIIPNWLFLLGIGLAFAGALLGSATIAIESMTRDE